MLVGDGADPSEFGSAIIVAFDVDGDNSLDFYAGMEMDALGDSNTKHDLVIYQFDGVIGTSLGPVALALRVQRVMFTLITLVEDMRGLLART